MASAKVFPTHVGVYMAWRGGYLTVKSFPHARGGVPRSCWFDFQLDRFPHARGGVPRYPQPVASISSFSPRTWGCTCATSLKNYGSSVFPTHVGVYRLNIANVLWANRFPHARGGVPSLERFSGCDWVFSPRTWGCTCGSNF